MDTRPTLEEQIRISKMTDEELMDFFLPHGFWGRIDFFIFRHIHFLWCIYRWRWYDKRTDSYSLKAYIKSIFKKA